MTEDLFDPPEFVKDILSGRSGGCIIATEYASEIASEYNLECLKLEGEHLRSFYALAVKSKFGDYFSRLNIPVIGSTIEGVITLAKILEEESVARALGVLDTYNRPNMFMRRNNLPPNLELEADILSAAIYGIEVCCIKYYIETQFFQKKRKLFTPIVEDFTSIKCPTCSMKKIL